MYEQREGHDFAEGRRGNLAAVDGAGLGFVDDDGAEKLGVGSRREADEGGHVGALEYSPVAGSILLAVPVLPASWYPWMETSLAVPPGASTPRASAHGGGG